MSVTSSFFGVTAAGKPVRRFTISDEAGMSAVVSDYGAILVSLYVPCSDGSVRDVVLGYDTLAEYVVEESDGYTVVTDLVTDGEINDIPAAWYRTVEEYEEAEYETLTYILDNGNEYIDLVFWLDGDTAEQEAAAIINTLSVDEALWAENLSASVVEGIDESLELAAEAAEAEEPAEVPAE